MNEAVMQIEQEVLTTWLLMPLPGRKTWCCVCPG